MRPSASTRAFTPALAWAAVVWIVGGLDNTPSVPAGLALDKLAHFAMYGFLGWLLGRGWSSAHRPARGWLIAAALLLGLADEARQALNPRRSAEAADFAADAAGVIAGFSFALRGRRRVPHDMEP
ncbi:MAG TPA: VanZ family protein [Longimicrobiales bacterium]|nr:VanZ family protein [Longimicrobiales bacterium]